jgi:chromosome segregation ATPase
MAERDFLDEFQESMNKLNESRRKIQEGVDINNQFTNSLRQKLENINGRLRQFAGEIQQLKETANNLQGQVNANTASIGDRERELQELNQRVAQSQQERDAAIANAQREKAELQDQIAQRQAKIDQDEQNILRLNDEARQANENLEAMTRQKEALDNELRGKGDLANQHAEEINRLTQEAQQAAQQKEDENQRAQQALLTRINDCERRIQEAQQKIAEKDEEINRVGTEHEATRGNAQTQSENLTRQIQDLNARNQQLVERIVQATQAIGEAADQLEAFSQNIKQARSEQDLNQMLVEIEQSLELIGRAIQGQHAAASPQGAPMAQGNLPDNTPVRVNVTGGPPTDIQLNIIKSQLSQKAQQLRRSNPNAENKYQIALNAINQAQTPEEVTNILRGVTIKNTQRGFEISGGRKTKKNKKQKGGFTYKSTSRRRSISSVPKSTKRTFRRSSR